MSDRPTPPQRFTEPLNRQIRALVAEHGWSEDYALGWIVGRADALQGYRVPRAMRSGGEDDAIGYRSGHASSGAPLARLEPGQWRSSFYQPAPCGTCGAIYLVVASGPLLVCDGCRVPYLGELSCAKPVPHVGEVPARRRP